jgi:hypothetical protein
MRRTRVVIWSLGAILLLARLAPAAGGGGMTLLSTPGGAWLATVREDAPLTTLEERDGWRKVRIEGWIPLGAPGPAGAPEAPPPPPPSPPAAGGTITGVLVPPAGQESAGPGSGILVFLVGDLDRLDVEHAGVGEGCKAQLAADDARLAELQQAVDQALNSSTNFSTATHRYDQAKSALATARRERAAHLQDCRARADALMSKYAVARTVSETGGRFEFQRVASGRYRVVAGDAAAARAWSIPCEVTGGEAIVLDPRAVAPGPDPYWKLQ